jgi:transcriptional regulator GlxA family with amidase domain
MASKYIAKDWRVFTVGETPTVRGNTGMTVVVDHTFDNAPAADILVVPGGLGTRPGADNAALVGYIKKAGGGAKYVTSVCTGAFLLHAAGFLTGRRATTHWASMAELRKLDGVTAVDERWVHDGNVITAAGVSAGIDGALYLVGQIRGPDEARNLQRLIEYYPAPPYAEVGAASS